MHGNQATFHAVAAVQTFHHTYPAGAALSSDLPNAECPEEALLDKLSFSGELALCEVRNR
jgi:hypothetical protein